ncbi:MAG TPA: GNAT family N-acetyltransferase [Anaerolineales bacterium]|nr:GNAT family N-acetyltransferase [Anaerolineales bacterium]
MIIRQATAADALHLSSLSRDVQNLHAVHHPHIFKVPERDDYALSFFEEMLADPAVRIFIAEEGKHAIGYLLCKLVERPENSFTFAARVLHIDQISVRPAAQGRGTGAALMEQAEGLAKEWEAQRIQLDSWDFNIAAHGFFERLGFEKFHFRFWRQVHRT